jgi:hypothetical protein
MASKRRIRKNSCKGKIQYKTEKEAQISRNFIFHKNPEIHTSYLNVYKCKFCGFFHIGHLNKKREKARKLTSKFL